MFSNTNFSMSEEAFLLRSLREVTMVWHRGTGQATFNLQIKDGQANLQMSFQLGKPDDHHLPQPAPRTRPRGERQKERDRARAAAHHARRTAASADTATETVAIAEASAASQVIPGTPVLTPFSPPPASSGTASARRPSTRSTTVLVKMKMAAFARSAAESALKETLPEFIPGFKEEIQYFMKECDFGDGYGRKYFNKYSSMFVFGFNIEKEFVTDELLERIATQWARKDKYWEHRPSEVIEIVT